MSKTASQGQGQGQVKAKEDEAVIKLSQGQELCLHGAFNVRVIEGCVLINGSFKCTPVQGSVPIYAPYTSPATTITTDPDSGATDSVLAFSDRRGALPSHHLFRNPSEVGTSNFALRPQHNPYADPFRFRTLRLLSDPRAGAVLATPPEWGALRAELHRIRPGAPPPRLVVCGDKGSGKSTLARYLVNTLLSKYPAVAFMDCDPGQPELGPPGMVSLSLVRAPLLGTPLTHALSVGSAAVERVAGVYMGEVSPAPIVGHYIRGLRYLFGVLERRKEGRDTPLVVNTCGWVAHIGKDVQLEVIGMARADFVVQLVSDDRVVVEKDEVEEVLYDVCDKRPKLRTFESLAKSGPQTAMSLNSADARTQLLLAYFGDHECAITAGKTWAVPFGDVAVGFVGQEVPPSQTFYALNGTVVGLCCNEAQMRTVKTTAAGSAGAKEVEEPGKKLPTLLVGEPRPCNCLGLGIIKSIDVENGMFYIITPVDLVKK